jgi:hypothetical protein
MLRGATILVFGLASGNCSKVPPAPTMAEMVDHHDAAPEDAGSDAESTAVSDAGEPPEEAWASDYFRPGAVGEATTIARRDAPALRYGSLSPSVCEAELSRRKVPFKRAEPTRGVRSPVRLQGPLHGVMIHSEIAEKKRAKAPFEIFDCRLVLALDDFTAMVAEKGVVEILHMSAFRSSKQRGCTSKFSNKQHCGALAVDVGTFVKSDGTKLVVDRDFNGRIGQATCVPGTGPKPRTAEAEELWGYVCASAARALFNVELTPNFNREHHNHLHLEVTPGVDWMLIH